MKKLLSSKWLTLALIVAVVAGSKLLTLKHFYLHDDIHIFRLNEYIECWRDGQIPCRWSNDLGKGFGQPLFVFYPPIMYFIPTIINLLGFSYVASFNIFSFLTFPLAAYGMYKLIESLTKNNKLAFLGSILYTLYPYHALNVFIRGVYAENLAWSLLPYIFWQFYELIVNNKNSYKPSIFLTLLILTHNISTLLFYPITILWCLLLITHNRKAIKNISERALISIKNLVLPIGLSAFFLIPMIVERGWVQSDSMIINYYSYLVHFVSFDQIFLSDFWGYGGSGPGLTDGMSFMIGKPYWITFILLNIYLIYRNRKNLKKLLQPVIVISLLVVPLTIFLMHVRSTPIWLLLKPLQYLQFPWRLLGLIGFFIILFITYVMNSLPKKIAGPIIITLSLIVAIQFFPFFAPEKYDLLTDENYLTGKYSSEQKEAHLYDYMPVTIHRVPEHISSGPIYNSTEPITLIENIEYKSDSLELDITQENNNIITLSIFEYPEWSAYLDSESVNYKIDEVEGLIKLEIPAGKHTVRIERREPTHRVIANWISIGFLFVLIGLVRKLQHSRDK